MVEDCLRPEGVFLTSPKRRDLLKGVNTEKSGNHIWLRKSPELKIAGDWERAQGKYHICLLSSSSSLHTAGWQERMVGTSQLCYCHLPPGLFAQRGVCRPWSKQVPGSPVSSSRQAAR